MRFDQLQADADGDGPIAEAATGNGALVRVEAVPEVSRTADEVLRAAAAAAPVLGAASAAGEASADEASAMAAEPAAPAAPAVSAPAMFAVSEIIRSAADQAVATWRVGSVPAQRRESPVVLPQPPAPPAETVAHPEPDYPAGDFPEPADAAVAEPEPEPEPEPELEPSKPDFTGEPDLDDRWPSARRQVSLLVRAVCLVVVAVLLGHRHLPDTMGFGSLVDSFLPWTFVPLALMVPGALLSRDKWAVGVTLLACGVWGGDFGPELARSGGSGPADLRILSQNVSSPAPDLTDIARLAEQRQADIVVLQGLSSGDVLAADQSVPARYPFHLAMYEFVVWSRFPLVHGSQPMDLAAHASDPNQPSQMADATSGQFGGLLRFTVQLDPNRVATVYAVHLPQPSLSHDGFGVARAGALEQLVAAVKAEPEPNLVVVGDLDLAQTDRGMASLLNSATRLVSVQAKAGAGFGFTWPASFPMMRLDDVLTRGLKPVRSVVLPAVGAKQAHRPIEADLRF
ncbi:MAG: hypothetical protein JF587_14965 [Catenulisporales bacterium]|nr:hypothetical protein [Catenulisporales bacterium]